MPFLALSLPAREDTEQGDEDTVEACTVLYCTVLYCTVLYCTVLYCTVLYCTVLYCDQVALQPGPPPGAGPGLAPPHRPHRQPVPPQGPPAHGLPGECRPVRTQVIHSYNNITYHIIILQTTLRQDAPAAAPAAEAAEG